MSNETPKPPVVIDASAIMARWEAQAQRAAELHPGNKANLFAALAAAGVTRIEVRFDGFGDSGAIEDVQAFAGDAPVELPRTTVEIKRLDHGDTVETVTEPLGDAIETLSYAFLEQTHAGWENNEGAFGDFTFDVAAGTITLDYNERFETSENHTHEL